MKYDSKPCKLLSAKALTKDVFDFVLSAPELAAVAQPGQFAQIRLPGHTLRRPISICGIDKTAGTLRFVFQIRGEGTAELAQFQPGSQIARIVDYDALEVSVDVDEYDIDAIEEGKEGEVYLNALDTTVPGTVTEIARNATTEAGVSYYPVKLEVEAAQNVRSGMSVEVSILNQQALGAVSLSLDALSYDEYNRPFVYLKDAEGKLVAEYVETGVSDGQYIEIVSGVSEGEAVYYQSNDLARFFAMQQRMMGVESR